MSSGKNIRNDPIAANRSVCCNIRFHGPVVDWLAHSESSLRKSGCCLQLNLELHSSKCNIAQHRDQVLLDESHMRDRL